MEFNTRITAKLKWGCLLASLLAFVVVDASENLADVQCGRQGPRASRIVGGQEANPGEFPWLVSLTRGGGHYCGGTLVNKRWVVTAAHCLCSGKSSLPADSFRISVGAHDIRSNTPKALEHKISNYIRHPDHRCSKFDNDVALLKLTQEVIWSATVWPACLPSGVGAPRFSAEEATVAGWGYIREPLASQGRADVLQKVKLMVVGNEQCQDWYKSLGKKVTILDTQMCAGFETGGKDACMADSGGPLMVGEGPYMTVVGVVSSGIGCARARLPGVYTRMSDFVPWIRHHVIQ